MGGVEVGLGLGGLAEAAVAPPHLDVALDGAVLAGRGLGRWACQRTCGWPASSPHTRSRLSSYAWRQSHAVITRSRSDAVARTRRARSTGRCRCAASATAPASRSGRLASGALPAVGRARPPRRPVSAYAPWLGGPRRVEVGARARPGARREVDRLRGQAGHACRLGCAPARRAPGTALGATSAYQSPPRRPARRRGHGRTGGPATRWPAPSYRYLQLIIHTWSTRRSAGTTSSPGAWVGPFHSTRRVRRPATPGRRRGTPGRWPTPPRTPPVRPLAVEVLQPVPHLRVHVGHGLRPPGPSRAWPRP